MPALTESDVVQRTVEIAQADSIEEAWACFVSAAQAFGFERVNYGYTRFRTGQSIGDPADVLFLSTHALDHVIRFHTSGTYLKSADYRWTHENTGACSWGWVHAEHTAGRLSAQEAEVLEMLGRGRAGYTVSFPVGAPRSKGAMGLAAGKGVSQAIVDAHWLAHESDLLALTHMAHLKVSQMPLPVAAAQLSPHAPVPLLPARSQGNVPRRGADRQPPLMLRAGHDQAADQAAGIYSWLPLGYKVLRKIEQIVHEEQQRAGHIPMLMPTLQSADLWRESGRYDDYGEEMLRITDRHGATCSTARPTKS
jgi:hypothetical protein